MVGSIKIKEEKLMKNLVKYLAVALGAGLTLVSCDYDTDNFDLLSDAPNPNATYYVQFKDAEQSFETGVSETGGLLDIETTVVVGLLGLPQSQDITIDLNVDPASTIDPNMYELSATSVTISAGTTSGSVTLKSNTESMPEDQVLQLILNIDAGANTATAGTKLIYDMKRIKFCALDQNAFVGSYTGNDANGNSTKVVVTMNAGQLEITGMAEGWMTGFWGEVIVAQETLPLIVNPVSGEFTIEEALYMTTTYLGDAQPAYNLVATGKLDACTSGMFIDYDLIQGGTGLAASYGPFEEEIVVQ